MQEAPPAAARAIRPLMLLTTGIAAAATATAAVTVSGPPSAHAALLALGVAAAVAALAGHDRGPWLLWLAAGIALGGGRGLQCELDHADLEQRMKSVAEVSLRVRSTVLQGWEQSRWGWKCRIKTSSARHRQDAIVLPPNCSLEVRGDVQPFGLPAPGTTIDALAAVRGDARRPMLVVSSPRLIRTVEPPRGLHRIRDRLARALLAAAGTDVRRIRAAELAAALSLGRRDLLPAARRQAWRRSGLAHMLAVSGLHVGVVGAVVWLLAVASGAPPGGVRLALLVVLPSYAILAGASPSAMRAAMMAVVYLVARSFGRAPVPLAAVLLVASTLLLARPTLAIDAGFQLTVVITAALVRWVPTLVEALPGPRWLTGAVAVPVVAQLAAAPVTAWHFRTAIPGAVLANLAVGWLLAPTLVAATAATVVAPLSPHLAALSLDLVGLGARALWLSGAVGRASMVVVPPLPMTVAALLAAAGWLALQPGRRHARWGAALWLAVLGVGLSWHLLRPEPRPGRVILLPVSDGMATLVTTREGAVLMDGGRRHREALELLATVGVRRLAAAVASHPDEDHVGGMQAILAHLPVDQLVMPSYMVRSPIAASLLRTARLRDVRVVPAVRGSAVRVGGAALEVLWPPAGALVGSDNERSVVARLRLDRGTLLFTSDIGRTTEHRLAAISSLKCDVLVVPHHGSRSSTSPSLLAAARPAIALIPAGVDNLYHHPHNEVLDRLRARRIPFRAPVHDGWCGAEIDSEGRWRPFP